MYHVAESRHKGAEHEILLTQRVNFLPQNIDSDEEKLAMLKRKDGGNLRKSHILSQDGQTCSRCRMNRTTKSEFTVCNYRKSDTNDILYAKCADPAG